MMSEFDWLLITLGVGFYAVSFIVGISILVRAYRQPESDEDRRLAQVDQELTEREHAIRCGLGGGWRS